MKADITVHNFSKYLFWDVNLETFDLERHKIQLIHKVLELGQIDDWELLKKVYGLETIKHVSLNLITLDPVTLSFVSALFKINKTEFRCYKHKQLVQNVWNS